MKSHFSVQSSSSGNTLNLFRTAFQPLAFFLLVLAGCTTPPPPDLDPWIPEGVYHFRSEIINQNNLVRATHEGHMIRITLLGDFEGGFDFVPEPGGALRIDNSRLDYPGLKRTYKGEGEIRQPGVASGTAIMWLKSAGPVSRNHRKGTWILRPATPEEVKKYEQKQQGRNLRLQRAQESGLQSQ